MATHRDRETPEKTLGTGALGAAVAAPAESAPPPSPAEIAVATTRPAPARRLLNALVRVKRDRIDRGLRAARFVAGLEPTRAPRVFCIAIQRTGTTSLGRFCADRLGLAVCEFDRAIANDWPRLWLAGTHERIFAAPDFRAAEVFVDDPWWYPRAYEHLAPRFPDALFVLTIRDEDAWFRSLFAHSGGRSPGHTDVHAAVWGREAEFEALVARAGSRRRVNWQGLALEGLAEHYKTRYRRHAEDARAWFAANSPGRLLELRLEDTGKFGLLACRLGFPEADYADVHVNAIAGRTEVP